jgi:hypothetical protein
LKVSVKYHNYRYMDISHFVTRDEKEIGHPWGSGRRLCNSIRGAKLTNGTTKFRNTTID